MKTIVGTCLIGDKGVVLYHLSDRVACTKKCEAIRTGTTRAASSTLRRSVQ